MSIVYNLGLFVHLWYVFFSANSLEEFIKFPYAHSYTPWMYLKIALTGSIFSVQNALNIVLRPGSAQTHWGSLQHFLDPVAGFKRAYF